jgi:hypothetical protein
MVNFVDVVRHHAHRRRSCAWISVRPPRSIVYESPAQQPMSRVSFSSVTTCRA